MDRAATELLRRFAWEGGHADVWRVLDDATAFAAVIEGLAVGWAGVRVTKVGGIEARGFVLGGAVAYRLGLGFVAIRKAGALFPGPKEQVDAAPDYRERRHRLEIQRRSVDAGDRILLVDDWIESGSQALAARDLVVRCGGVLVGIAVLVDQLDPGVRADLPPVRGLVDAADLPGA